MTEKRNIVTIIFSIDVSLLRAREIMKGLCDKCSPYLSYKKFGILTKENIKEWRSDMVCMVGYSGEEKQCLAMCSFLDENDASLFYDYISEQIDRNRNLQDEIIHFE